MTLDSYFKNNQHNSNESQYNLRCLKKIIKSLNQVIDALGEFKNNYNKKFNFSKLAKYLEIPNSEVNNTISLILNFQEKFETVFKNHRLKNKIINNQIYITLDKKIEKRTDLKEFNDSNLKKINFQHSQAKLFSDIIYVFKHVKKGKGFDLSTNGSELLSNLKKLKDEHKYLFEVKNNLIYPSELGLKLGNLILSYNKSNKKVENIEINNYKFIIN